MLRLAVELAVTFFDTANAPSPAMVVIPGTTNPDHLRANIAAAEIAENLADAEVARLTGLVDESTAVINQRH